MESTPTFPIRKRQSVDNPTTLSMAMREVSEQDSLDHTVLGVNTAIHSKGELKGVSLSTVKV